MDWILASASPRRKELLKQVIAEFEIVPSTAEEKTEGNLSPKELVKSLACLKAAEVAARPKYREKAVLGSDTVVACEGEILGKPKDEADALRMLTKLSGNVHEVYTGVCMLFPDGNGGRIERVEADCTKVFFLPLKQEEILAYIATGSPMDKAGAYGMQDGGLVERIEGSFSNVIGLPVELCKAMIAKAKADGIDVE